MKNLKFYEPVREEIIFGNGSLSCVILLPPLSMSIWNETSEGERAPEGPLRAFCLQTSVCQIRYKCRINLSLSRSLNASTKSHLSLTITSQNK
jgi:hypothetical protein